MRSIIPVLVAGLTAAGAGPAQAETRSVFAAGEPLLLAHEDDHGHGHDEHGHDDHGHDGHDDHDHHEHRHDRPLTRQELRARKRELRQDERRLARRSLRPRAWLGVGAGAGFGSVDIPCTAPSNYDCDESSTLGTYSANLTMTGRRTGIRLRAVRAQDKGSDSRTPYEMAAMVGSRFGPSNWYGFVGAGRILHADDEFQGDAHGFAWEFVFAPASSGGMGFELSFQGNAGRDVDYGLFNLGVRFGKLQ